MSYQPRPTYNGKASRKDDTISLSDPKQDFWATDRVPKHADANDVALDCLPIADQLATYKRLIVELQNDVKTRDETIVRKNGFIKTYLATIDTLKVQKNGLLQVNTEFQQTIHDLNQKLSDAEATLNDALETKNTRSPPRTDDFWRSNTRRREEPITTTRPNYNQDRHSQVGEIIDVTDRSSVVPRQNNAFNGLAGIVQQSIATNDVKFKLGTDGSQSVTIRAANHVKVTSANTNTGQKTTMQGNVAAVKELPVATSNVTQFESPAMMTVDDLIKELNSYNVPIQEIQACCRTKSALIRLLLKQRDNLSK